MMKRKVCFSAFCVGLFIQAALSTPVCNTQLQLSQVLQDSYQANANLVRLGVASQVVGVFYNDALRYVARECNCSSTLLDEPCVDTKFNANSEVAALRNLADSDEGVATASRLFRLYDSQKSLRALSGDEQDRLDLGLELLKTHTESLQIINSPAWQPAQFPSDEAFFQDDSSAREAACASFNAVTHPNNITFPATAVTAYVLSLVQVVRVANLAAMSGKKVPAKKMAASMVAANAILHNHTSFVFEGVRCKKQSGDALHMPIAYMEDYKTQVELLLAALPNTETVSLNNVRSVIASAKKYLPTLVQKLSSLESYGDSDSILYTDAKSQVLVERRSVNEIMANDVGVVTNAYQFLDVVGGGPGDEIVGEGRGFCAAGWIHVTRAVSVMSADEECCSDMCTLLSLSLSDPFLWGIEQENCCQHCNMYVCADQGLLSSSIPLHMAPPIVYPTAVDL